jgi:hypothetical protein
MKFSLSSISGDGSTFYAACAAVNGTLYFYYFDRSF